VALLLLLHILELLRTAPVTFPGAIGLAHSGIGPSR
jgi:hypothetical protein